MAPDPTIKTSDPGTPSLRELYQRDLHGCGYVADAAQSLAVDRLEALRTQLLNQPTVPLMSRWLARLRARRWSKRSQAGADAPTAVQGLYLWGGVGRGKTWLMDLFYDSLPKLARRRLHFHHFMREVHDSLRQLRSRPEPLQLVAQQFAARARLLCLDELYVDDIADAMLLAGLFEALLDYGTTMVITSNLPPGQLYRDGLQRARFLPAIALLERRLEVLCLEGAVDYRLRQLQRRSIYLSSRDGASPEQLRRLFEQLAGAHGDTTKELSVQGRTLHALQRRGEVVWFSFAALCEGPRSQRDYGDIAREFHTVLLSDVPVFSQPQQDNAARRFIALVDELYDQGVKLVLSAAASPAELYRGEQLQLQFRRTASRLVEMQHEAYLARAHGR